MMPISAPITGKAQADRPTSIMSGYGVRRVLNIVRNPRAIWSDLSICKWIPCGGKNSNPRFVVGWEIQTADAFGPVFGSRLLFGFLVADGNARGVVVKGCLEILEA